MVHEDEFSAALLLLPPPNTVAFWLDSLSRIGRVARRSPVLYRSEASLSIHAPEIAHTHEAKTVAASESVRDHTQGRRFPNLTCAEAKKRCHGRAVTRLCGDYDPWLRHGAAEGACSTRASASPDQGEDLDLAPSALSKIRARTAGITSGEPAWPARAMTNLPPESPCRVRRKRSTTINVSSPPLLSDRSSAPGQPIRIWHAGGQKPFRYTISLEEFGR